jgi:hypothetical protein
LLANLTEPARTAEFHRKEAIVYLDAVSRGRSSSDTIKDWFRVASQRRREIDQAETSLKPRSKILEPGFRVIFPKDNLDSQPGRLLLDPSTGRAIPGL